MPSVYACGSGELFSSTLSQLPIYQCSDGRDSSKRDAPSGGFAPKTSQITIECASNCAMRNLLYRVRCCALKRVVRCGQERVSVAVVRELIDSHSACLCSSIPLCLTRAHDADQTSMLLASASSLRIKTTSAMF